MPLQSRRPNLPALSLPMAIRTAGDSLHTPNPFTKVPDVDAPLVMTPDTPSFSLRDTKAQAATDDAPWTEDEEGILQSYLSAPARAYPPGSLPPASVLDEFTTQLVARASWPHAWAATRARLFSIARHESMGLGHARQPVSRGPTRPKLAVLGGKGINRQMHSMDSLYGDSEEEGSSFGEALRLSGNLQTTASNSPDSVLTSGSGLSSPLAFTFNFHPQLPPTGKKPGFPFAGLPRPTSLLQRGRSFTSADVPAELRGHSRNDSHDSTGSISTLGENDVGGKAMCRSASSPVGGSGFGSSSPSPSSSESNEHDNDRYDRDLVSALGIAFEATRTLETGAAVDGDAEDESPFTPVNQTFPSSIHRHGYHGNAVRAASTPSITLTLESPPGPSATAALARLSLAPASMLPNRTPTPTLTPLAPLAPIAPSAPLAPGRGAGVGSGSGPGGIRRPQPAFGRSMSDTLTMSSARPLLFSDGSREPKRQRALRVLVPRGLVGGEGELKSPFEHKPVPSLV